MTKQSRAEMSSATKGLAGTVITERLFSGLGKVVPEEAVGTVMDVVPLIEEMQKGAAGGLKRTTYINQLISAKKEKMQKIQQKMTL